MKTMRIGAVLALALTLGATALTSTAHAVELYWDPVTGQVVRRPTRYLMVDPNGYALPPPRRVTVVVPPARPVPPPATVVVQPAPTPTPIVPVRPVPEPAPRDPYDTEGSVILGAGAGALVIFGQGQAYSTPSYRLHLGVAMDQAEFGLRFDLAPGALDVDGPDGATSAAIYTAGASFGYRFFPDAFVHPVLGVGLETLFLNPEGLESSRAFAATARFGLELAVPVSDGAFALGLDVTGHHPLVTNRGYLGDRTDMVGFGVYADWRF